MFSPCLFSASTPSFSHSPKTCIWRIGKLVMLNWTWVWMKVHTVVCFSKFFFYYIPQPILIVLLFFFFPQSILVPHMPEVSIFTFPSIHCKINWDSSNYATFFHWSMVQSWSSYANCWCFWLWTGASIYAAPHAANCAKMLILKLF